MLIQVNSLDSWERNRVEGYGIVEIPHQPGFHELTIRTFKPDDDLYTRIMQFYIKKISF
jgi:Meckel syndrome type 1 protein